MNFQQKLALMNSTGRKEKKLLLTDRGRNWGYHETMDLLTLWSDDTVQTELEASVRNQHVYEKIAAAMQQRGHPRIAEQCRDKIKKLKKEYNDVLGNRVTPSRGASAKYYEIVDKVMRNRIFGCNVEPEVLLSDIAILPDATVNIKVDPDAPADVPVIIDSYSEPARDQDVPSDYSPSPSESSEVSRDGENRTDGIMTNGSQDKHPQKVDKTWVPTSSPAALSVNLAGPSPPRRMAQAKRRRKTTKAEKMMTTIVDRFVDSLHEAETKYLVLEEKRLKMTMEMEERRQEREERRRREERQHEIRLMQMITQVISTVSTNSGATPQQSAETGAPTLIQQLLVPVTEARPHESCNDLEVSWDADSGVT